MKPAKKRQTQQDSLQRIIDLYKKDVDVTLLRENLKLSVDERIEKLDAFLEFLEEMRSAGKVLRQQKSKAYE